MALQNKKSKSKIFIKNTNIKKITIPILFFFTFFLVIFNKTDYFLVNQIKSTGIDVINPIAKVISYPVRFTANTVNYVNEFRLVKKENIKLKEEVTRLKKWQTLALKNNQENIAYKKLLNSTSNDLNIVKTASIIQNSPQLYSRSILISAGLDHKVEKNFIVINERGLVGKIILVTKKNSKVLLVNDQNSSIPVKSFNRDFFAVLKGSTNGKFLISSFVKENKKPLVGDLLVTSGNVGIYPKNILVGKIIKVSDEKIIVLPFVDIKNIEFVQIVTN